MFQGLTGSNQEMPGKYKCSGRGSKPETQMPSKRTGCARRVSDKSSSATSAMSDPAFMRISRVRERVICLKSANFIFNVTVRPLRFWRIKRCDTFSDCSLMQRSSSDLSRILTANVRSLPSLLGGGFSCTTRLSMPRARS